MPVAAQDIDTCAEVVSATVALVGAVIVGVEYFQQRREKRFQRAAELEAELTRDPILRFTVMLLDWGVGTFPVPAEYRDFTGSATLDHDLDLLYKALRPGLSQAIRASREGTLYRQTFVTLFNYLERVVRRWKRGYVDPIDIPQTRWLAQQLIQWPYARLGRHPTDDWFIPAMESWYPTVFDGQSLAKLAAELALSSPEGPPRRGFADKPEMSVL